MLQKELIIETGGRALIDITARIAQNVSASGVEAGLCHVFLLHTSASLLINENADPDVLADLETFFSELVEDGDARFLHRAEGPDDMSAHIRAALTQTELTLPVQNGRLVLGTWQGIYLWEHRYRPHRRRLVVTIR
ncbi:MAG TPA: secondary thiamine-phosphate synthase enzyme YjbQ [Wenzhouxiangella sp.]|nr:secondary thiamine-phosphate synthase enzyme YjbQ [Wenzhouxiangella sp.]